MSAPATHPQEDRFGNACARFAGSFDARYRLSFFDERKRCEPSWWNFSRNEVGRGIYGRAMLEQRRLEAASDGELDAELNAISHKGA